jgi:hypothetical protein
MRRLGPVRHKPQSSARAKLSSNACTASQTAPVAVLCCCTPGPAVRIMLLTSGAKGTRTLTPCLQTTGSTSTHVHPRRSPSPGVLPRPPGAVPVAVLSCCTRAASAGGRGGACAPCARQRQGGPQCLLARVSWPDVNSTRDLYDFEIEPEVRDWLDSLSDSDFKRVDEVCGMLAQRGTNLGGPWSDHLDGAAPHRVPQDQAA